MLFGCAHAKNESPANEDLVQVEAKIVDMGFTSLQRSNNKPSLVMIEATLLLVNPSDYRDMEIKVSFFIREIHELSNFPSDIFTIGNGIRFKIRPSKLKDNGNVGEEDLMDLERSNIEKP